MWSAQPLTGRVLFFKSVLTIAPAVQDSYALRSSYRVSDRRHFVVNVECCSPLLPTRSLAPREVQQGAFCSLIPYSRAYQTLGLTGDVPWAPAGCLTRERRERPFKWGDAEDEELQSSSRRGNGAAEQVPVSLQLTKQAKARRRKEASEREQAKLRRVAKGRVASHLDRGWSRCRSALKRLGDAAKDFWNFPSPLHGSLTDCTHSLSQRRGSLRAL